MNLQVDSISQVFMAPGFQTLQGSLTKSGNLGEHCTGILMQSLLGGLLSTGFSFRLTDTGTL